VRLVRRVIWRMSRGRRRSARTLRVKKLTNTKRKHASRKNTKGENFEVSEMVRLEVQPNKDSGRNEDVTSMNDEATGFKQNREVAWSNLNSADKSVGCGLALSGCMPVVRHVVCLGCRCSTASFFEKFGKRKYSGPFDWMFSCPKMVAHCLRDNFRDFLRRDLYCYKDTLFDSIGLPPGSAPRERNLIGHNIFSDWMCGVGRGTIFNHRDPLYNDEDYAYTLRTVERFQLILDSGAPKLFTVLNLDPELWIEDDIQQLFEALQARTSNFDLVAVNCTRNQGASARNSPAALEKEAGCDGTRLLQYSLHCVGDNTGKDFFESSDTARIHSLLVDPYQFELANDPLPPEMPSSMAMSATVAAAAAEPQPSFATANLDLFPVHAQPVNCMPWQWACNAPVWAAGEPQPSFGTVNLDLFPMHAQPVNCMPWQWACNVPIGLAA